MAQSPPGSIPSSYQDDLNQFCQTNGMRPPTYQVMSDRRGGRTAWSCTVQVQGMQPIAARFWYDGQYVNNAREDAAQVALQRMGLQPPSGQAPAHLQGQGQQSNQGQQSQPSASQNPGRRGQQ